MLFGENQIFSILGLIGLFSPAYVNILISRTLSPITEQGFKKQRLIFFLCAWVLATLAFLLNATKGSRLESPVAVVIFALFALLPAFVIRAVYSKYTAVRKSLFSMLHPRSSFIWYLLALLIPWVIKCVSLPITKQLGWEVLSDPGRVDGVANVLMLVTISILYEVFYAGGLNEEVGWTGFAMPRLQGCFSPLLASMILWFFWILWHIPFQLAGYWNPEMGDFIRSLVGSFFARFIFTWLFNKTRGGILSAILFCFRERVLYVSASHAGSYGPGCGHRSCFDHLWTNVEEVALGSSGRLRKLKSVTQVALQRYVTLNK